jgi:hypothetical protein
MEEGCGGTPRYDEVEGRRACQQTLTPHARFRQVHGDGVITSEVVSDGLARLEVDCLGLERLDEKSSRGSSCGLVAALWAPRHCGLVVSESVESLEINTGLSL